MSRSQRTPAELARRFAERARQKSERPGPEARDAPAPGAWSRQTFRMPRDQARETAREWFERYPKAAYMTRVESWRVLEDGLIEFTMRRLPSAD